MRRNAVIGILLCLFISASLAGQAAPGKEHKFHGTVEKVDPAGKTMTVNGQKVEGWKDAGTFTYTAEKEDIFQSLKPGDGITARVLEGDDSTLYDVHIDPLLNMAHIHLLLNHFPTIGFGIALGLFLVALIGKSEELKRASLVIFFLIAAVAIPTYMSGNAAQDVLKDRADVSQTLIRAHEDAALVGFIFMEITGFMAWLALWQFRLLSRVPRWAVPVVLVLSIVTFGLMANAANIGGNIRHPEITSAQETATAEGGAGFARSVGLFVTGHVWMWPSCETLHFVGLSTLFSVVLLVDLRMLGMAKGISFAALYQLLPLGMLGFLLNLLTGMFFFIGVPDQYTKNSVFYWKMLFVVLAAINVLYFMLLDEPWTVGAGDDAPLTAKLAAASAIFLWVGILFCGHMLPFIGNAF